MDPLSQPVLLALIVAVPAILSPVLLALLSNWSQRKGKEQDWARQDEVAAQAVEAAKLLLAANERVAATSQETVAKLDVIHSLVNSGLTAEKQAVYDSTRRELLLLLHVIKLDKEAGHSPSREALAEVDATRKKIEEMRLDLEERERQAKLLAAK